MDSSAALQSHRRPLGATGLSVSPIGLGTVKLGRNRGVKYPAPFDLPSDADATRLLETARELDINLIDTAAAYGVAEERLGRLLPGRREEWVIVTKAGEEFDGQRSDFDFTAAGITASVQRSLQRLNTEVLDVVLLHSDGSDRKLIGESGGDDRDWQTEGFEALARLKRQGHIRAYGISTKTPEGALLAVERGVDIVMLTLNPLATDDLPAIKTARAKGVGVLVKKALVSGHVGAAAEAGSDRHALTPERCIDFALSTPGVSSVVVGTINPDHLRANAAAAARVLESSRSTP